MTMRSPWGKQTPILTGKTLKLEEKLWLAYQVNHLRRSPTEVGGKHGIHRKTIQKYADRVAIGLTLHDSGGAPGKFDKESRKVITEKLGGEKRIQESEESAKLIYKEEQLATAKRRNQASCQQESPDKRTIKKMEKDLNIKTLGAEETTDARAIACGNVRNAVSHVVQFKTGSELAPHPCLQFNFDATTVQEGDKTISNKSNKRKAKMIGAVMEKKSIKVKKVEGAAGMTAFFIKIYTLIAATGSFGPLVYCVADASMNEGEIDWHVVSDGTFGLQRTDSAIIVFCKNRSMNAAFYKAYWLHIVLLFIEEERKRHGRSGEKAMCNCDGEDTQIDVLTDEEVFGAITTANVEVDKPSGGTSEITQACDQDNFKELKKENKKITDADVDIESTEFKVVTGVIAAHQTRMKKAMSATHVRMAAFGLVRARMAAMNSFTAPRAIKSFRRIGHWPFDEVKVLKQCTTKLTALQEKAIFDAVPKLSEQYKLFGELVQKDFDDAKIFDNDIVGKKLKEDSATNRKRSTRLTHPIQHQQMLTKQPVKVAAKEKRVAAKKRKIDQLENGQLVVGVYKPKKKKAKTK